MQRSWSRTVVRAVTGAAALAVLSGCGVLPGSIAVDGTAGPAVATTTPAAGDTGAGAPASKGCPAGGATVPENAGRARTVDLDGDGKPDTLWLAVEDDIRVLGVETASGARITTTFTSAGPTSATAVGGRLGDGSAVILLDLSREARLYGVIDCRIYGYENAQGRPYAFDEGLTGRGTGVGCPEIGTDGRRLVGYLAEPTDATDSYQVSRTLITLDPKELLATNGRTETVVVDAPATDANVRRAKQIICGPGGRAHEPAG